MSRFRIVFLGTPEFALPSLEMLIKDEHYDVVGVITQPDRPSGRKMNMTASPVKQLAQHHGLRILTPEKINQPEALSQIAEWHGEAAVVVAFGQILTQRFFDLFPLGSVNVHASILPRWRGAAPIQRAVMAGDKESGVSLQKMVRKLDAGDVLGIRRLAIDDDMDAQTLHDRLKVLGADLLHVELMDYLRGNLIGTAQDESLVTIAPKIVKDEAMIEWQNPARQIFNQVRGLVMGPVCWTSRNGKQIKLWHTQIENESVAGKPAGTVLEVSNQGIVVACGTGSLRLLELQPESKGRQTAQQFLSGYGIQAGEILG